MSVLRKLAGQTAIYGLSSILGRLLNYLLVPIYTYRFTTGEYGVVTEMYAYVAILIVVLTYGMETAFFRFSKTEDAQKVYSTSLYSLLFSSLAFILLVFLFKADIGILLGGTSSSGVPYETYVAWFACIIAADAFTSIPFAYLREKGKALRFALLKLFGIAINIGLNLFFVVWCMDVFKQGETHAMFGFVSSVYQSETGIGYIFIANLAASVATILFLLPEIRGIRYGFDKQIWKKMMVYALPLLILGLAGNINETIDRVLLKYLLPGTLEENLQQVGVYGACYKLSILMTIFIQAFRYAAEPFFFSQHKEQQAQQTYARVMLYFVLVCSFIFLGVMLNISWIQFFLGSHFREGLHVVPVLLLANLLLGVFFNLSIWYKLSDKTLYGAWISLTGACITLLLNLWWIPLFGYAGSAWATLVCYASMCVFSYIAGQKFYPVPYPLFRMGLYLSAAIVLYVATLYLPVENTFGRLLINNLGLMAFACIAWFAEKPKKMLI